MGKTEVLVDTEFLQGLSARGKNIEAFKRVLSELAFTPVLHPYIAQKELDMFPYVQRLIDENYIRVAQYEEFLQDEADRELYSMYFKDIHDEFREILDKAGGRKQLSELKIPPNYTVFNYRKAGMSLGDVHMILMASFAQIPVILSDDSDMKALKAIAERKFSYSEYKLKILGCVEVLEIIASNKDTLFSKKELIDILKDAGESRSKSTINKAWNKGHAIFVSFLELFHV